MKITEIKLELERRVICESVLRALPSWFGIEEAIVGYVNAAATMDTFAAYGDDRQLLGFLSLNYHFGINAEIHVMGVIPGAHRQGIGKALVAVAIESAKEKSAKFLSVKTLSPSRENAEYARTRKFYEALGFLKFEEFPNLWGAENPCLEMVLPL